MTYDTNALRRMRTPKLLVPGTVIEWEETLCRHRGTYKDRRIVVAQLTGNNLEDTHGSWHYWTDMKYFTALRATTP